MGCRGCDYTFSLGDHEGTDIITREITRCDDVRLAEDTPLVSSGLIDSMAVVGIIAKLEDVTSRRMPAGKVHPRDLDSVKKMLATAERVGKPRR